MEQSNIIQKINQKADQLSESDVDQWILPELLTHYKERIRFFSRKLYAENHSVVADKAFEALAKQTLGTAIKTFLFNKRYWETGRDLNSYLLKSLKYLYNSNFWQNLNSYNRSSFVCPGCKEYNLAQGIRYNTFVKPEGKLFRCSSCTEEIEKLEKYLKNPNLTDPKEKTTLEQKLRLRKAFALHSKEGYECEDCRRFIPHSLTNSTRGIFCPHLRCFYFGSIDNLNSATYPKIKKVVNYLSLDFNPYEQLFSDGSVSRHEIGESLGLNSGDLAPDSRLELAENFEKELKILKEVIKQQVESVKRNYEPEQAVLKLLMYEAYKNLVESQPEDMAIYLIEMRQNLDFPIQSRIFQEFCRLVEDSLPFDLKKFGETYKIISLCDPNLDVFEGKSIYESRVDYRHIIPNQTKEIYRGGRENKSYGPCFLGKLLNVINLETGESILSKVRRYSFSQIELEPEIVEGTPVQVSHFRIPSHYELRSLVHLQRIRRSIVDKAFYRLKGTKRIVGNFVR